jgi:hypothetical protein
MSSGYAGAYFHGGRGAYAAFGQYMSLSDPNSYHPAACYTPICSLNSRQHAAEPLYYGMQFASNFAGATLIDLDFSPGEVNASAYAAKLSDGQTAVALINKDPVQSLDLDLSAFESGLFLQAPSLTSRTQVQIVGPKPIGDMSSIPPACAVLLRSKARKSSG